VTLGHRDQRSEVRYQTYVLRIFPSTASDRSRRSLGEGGSAEQLFNAVDQATYQERFHEVLYVVLV
jgi:hypothetical protein